MNIIFATAVWGDGYIDYLLDYGIPSQLAPNNIPAIVKKASQSVYYIYTFSESDRAKIVSGESFKELSKIVETRMIILSECDPGYNKYDKMGYAHDQAFRQVESNSDLVFFLVADIVWGNGTFENAYDRFNRNPELRAYCCLPPIRVGEEALLPRMSPYFNGQALEISNRELVTACLDSLHAVAKSYNRDSNYFALRPGYLWWPVGDSGFVIHCCHPCGFVVRPGKGKQLTGAFDVFFEQNLRLKSSDIYVEIDTDKAFGCDLQKFATISPDDRLPKQENYFNYRKLAVTMSDFNKRHLAGLKKYYFFLHHRDVSRDFFATARKAQLELFILVIRIKCYKSFLWGRSKWLPVRHILLTYYTPNAMWLRLKHMVLTYFTLAFCKHALRKLRTRFL